MIMRSGANRCICKEHGLGEQSDGTGEEDEDESEGEEAAEKSFVWENAAHPHLEGLGHSKAGRDEGGEVGDQEQIIRHI